MQKQTKRINNNILLLAQLRNQGWRIMKTHEDGSGYTLFKFY